MFLVSEMVDMQLPDTRQLKIFTTLEQTRSFTAAAKELDITQSAVSHSMKALETLLGCELIERLGKKCILTPHGEVFLHHAKLSLQHLSSAVTKIKTLNEWGYNSIKVGVSNSLSQHVIPKTLAEFYESEQKCEVFVTMGDTKVLLSLLDKGELDIAYGLRRSKIEEGYLFTPIVEDELCFITDISHPWCDKAPAQQVDYDKERFITYNDASITGQILKQHLSGIGIRQRTILTLGNMEAIKEMVTLGLGVGIIPTWIAQKELSSKTLVIHKITPSPKREWGYYISRAKTLSLKEEVFVQAMKTQLQTVVKGG